MSKIILDDIIVFDADAFNIALSEKPGEYLSLFKKAVADGHENLKQAFEQGADTTTLVHSRADFIDQILIQAFNHCFNDCQQCISLIAVGGYGRGELHPASDIDLMLLLADKENSATKELIEQFLMLLWDIKLEIGHSVRTLSECVEEAKADITVTTNIMEARLLCGDKQLFDDMLTSTGPDKIWDSKSFFEGKLDEQVKRHRKFDGTAYNLEPNIKENPGGLRDIQMIDWVAKRYFGAKRLSQLIDHGFLTRAEYDALKEGQALLWRIRLCLHYITGRREDRLLFDLQRELAVMFGYEDGNNNLAIEQFMQRYYRTVMELERLNEMLLQLFRQAILYSDSPEERIPLNQRFNLIDGYIEAAYPTMFEENPTALLEVFVMMELRPDILGVRAETIRLIRENTHLIDDKFRQSETAKQLFMEIMSQTRGVTNELRRMNRYGILAAYIPGFDQIVGRMQYDLFHAYTVDQHTIFVIRNMRRLSVPEFAHEFPLASGIYHHLKKPQLLYLAGLFHDIAKGRNGRHEELGAVDAEAFCLNHGLSKKDSELVAWLVRKHLLMSMVAQRKDISDPEIISAFCQEVESQKQLDYLYLLTMCDIRATNPKHWNSWKDNLLAELYHKASKTLRAGLNNPINRDMAVQQTKTSALRLLTKDGYAIERVNETWSHFTDDYFLHHSPYQIRWHTKLVVDSNQNDLPLVAANISETGQIEILIYTHEKKDLFANVASTIDQLGLTIVNAELMATNDGLKLESFTAMEEHGHDPEPYRIKEITDRLKKRLSEEASPDVGVVRPASRVQKHFHVETDVRFEQLPGKDVTVLSITTNDRPGLLARLAEAFMEKDIRIHNAKISTAGETASDVFHITDNDGKPILDEQACQHLRSIIVDHLNQ